MNLYELVDAGVEGPSGPVLEHLHWTVRDHATTVLLGPAGNGKSLMLRRMAGRSLPEGYRATGQWLREAVPLPASASGSLADVAWARQRAAHRMGHAPPSDESTWRACIGSGARVLLLDEPTVDAVPSEVEQLVRALDAQRRRGASVVVTHDVGFARRIADDACLLVGGSIAAAADAPSFFDHPPSDLVRRFISQGNCWLSGPRPPDLPSHFRWLLPGRLAGMGRPGLLGDEALDLEAIACNGVELLISLTAEPIPAERLRPFGIAGRHAPVRDMGVPTVRVAASLCSEIDRRLERGGAVAVHCHAGLGRTGTLLAAYLVWQGKNPADAVEQLRRLSPSYIQSEAQLVFIERFAEET